MLWVLKRTVSFRRFFEYSNIMFWLKNKKKTFLLSTLTITETVATCFHNNRKIQHTKKFDFKIVNIFLPIIFNICFRFSKEPLQ